MEGRDPHVAIRTCVGCRQRGPRGTLERYVARKRDGRVLIMRDPGGSMSGRGAWVHADAVCLQAACERGGFRRAFRIPRSIAAELAEVGEPRQEGTSM